MVEVNFDEVIAFVEANGGAGVSKIRQLCDHLDGIIQDYKDMHYIRVEINNRKGRVVDEIRKRFPQFTSWWRGDENTIGTNYVLVPASMWNDETKNELSKFDSFVGHHIESHKEWRVKKDAKLSTYYTANRDRWTDRELFNREHNEHPDWFEEVEVVTSEWTAELRVIDSREYTKDYSSKGQIFRLEENRS